MLIPGLVLKQMYTLGSLENVEDGVRFSLKNRLSNATLTRLKEVRIDGKAVPLDRLTLELNGGRVAASGVSPTSAVAFPLAKVVSIHARGDQLEKGQHEIGLEFETTPSAISPSKSRIRSPSGSSAPASPRQGQRPDAGDGQGAPEVRRGVHRPQDPAH